LGKGTTFKFTIETRVSDLATSGYQLNISGLRDKKVLIVDDNARTRAVLKEQLMHLGQVPTLASSAREALTVLDRDPVFDLILTDLHMPLMNGVELAEIIHERYPALPVILLGYIGNDRTKVHEGLFSAMLTKPVKHAVLAKQILKVLRENTTNPREERRPTIKEPSGELAQQYPMSILVAEDNLINMKIAQRVLGKLGYTTDAAGNGKEALDAIQLKEYDLILMDVQMPELDGLEATKLIRQRSAHQPVIIAMTANAMQGDREICLDAGMNDYISKPVKLEDLINMIGKWGNVLRESRKAS
jgi:CheY-like chemotaxis protein